MARQPRPADADEGSGAKLNLSDEVLREEEEDRTGSIETLTTALNGQCWGNDALVWK